MRRCLAAVVTIIMALVLALPVMANPFADVPETHWAYEAVKRLAASGLVQGFPDGIFKGAEEMTRYQMAIVVARVLSDLDSQIREAVEISKAAAGESPAAQAPVEKIIERVIVEKPVIERIIEQHIVEKEGSIDRAILDARVAEIIAIIDALKTEFTQELNVLGVRVTALEEQLALANAKLDDVNRLTSEINARLAQTASKLEGHIAGHERVRISGDSKVSFEDVDITAATNAVTPWVDPFDPGRVAGDPDYVYQPTSKFNHDLNLKLTANIANGVVAEAGLATVRNIFGSKDSWDSSEFRLKENGLYLDVVAPGVLRHMRVGHVAEPVGAFSSLTLQSHKLRDDDVPRYEGVLTEMVYGRFSGTGLFWRLQEPVSGDGQAKYAQYAVAVDTKLSLTDNVIIGATYVAAFDDEKSLENGPASPVKDTVAGLNARVALAPGWAASTEFARNIKEDAQYTATEMSLDGRIGLLRLGTAYTRIDDGYHPYFVEVPYDEKTARGLNNNEKTVSINGTLPLSGIAGGDLTLSAGYEKTGEADWGYDDKDLVTTKSAGAEYSRSLFGADVVAGIRLALAHRDSVNPDAITDSLKIARSISAEHAPLSIGYAVTDTRDLNSKAAISRQSVFDFGFRHSLTPEIALRGGYKSYKMNDDDTRTDAKDEEYTVKTAGVDLGFNLTTVTRLIGSYEYRRVDYSDATPWTSESSEVAGVKTTAKAGLESRVTPGTKLTGEVGVVSGAVRDPGVEGRMLTGTIGLAHHIADNTDLELSYKATSFRNANDPNLSYQANIATASLVVKF